MRDQLKELRTDIEEQFGRDCTSFFGEYRGVKGFFGTGPIWFVCYKPSKNPEGFPTYHDKFFYRILKQYGLENAHITDISKIRGPAEAEITEEELEKNVPFLKREMVLLEPDVIVAVGRKAERTIGKMDLMSELPKAFVYHYTYASRFGHREVFEKQIRGAVLKYERL
jgi:uracil-DNA glycosylase family 4